MDAAERIRGIHRLRYHDSSGFDLSVTRWLAYTELTTRVSASAGGACETMAITVPDIASPPQPAPRVPEPFCLVVFGASGDLTHRKLLPAIFSLYCEGLLPKGASVIGFARSDKTDEGFRDELRRSIGDAVSCNGSPVTDELWNDFASRLHYHRGSYDSLADFRSLGARIESLGAAALTPCNRLFYLATPPTAFVPIVEQLRASGLSRADGSARAWARIVVEKPFGRDQTSAAALDESIRAGFDEDKIFRIDHYLGKETVQNILVLRFANSIFEPIWNQKYVDHVQITVGETLGVEGRGGYYDQAGALRDMVQNHMMHLLSLIAMEPPHALDADSIRDEKVAVLQSLRPIPCECATGQVVRAQYEAGGVGDSAASGYRGEPDVAADSTTETYVAFKAFVDNWRWAGVPFYLRSGKRLARRCTEIAVCFKPVPPVLFNTPSRGPLSPNILAVRVQPNEGISMEFQVKVPGAGAQIRSLKMDFEYAGAFGSAPPDAYQRLLLDAALGDATLFTRSDEVEAAWKFVSPILDGCARQRPEQMASYPAGSWGPKEADALITADGNHWHLR